jgi:hypothetical protein
MGPGNPSNTLYAAPETVRRLTGTILAPLLFPQAKRPDANRGRPRGRAGRGIEETSLVG